MTTPLDVVSKCIKRLEIVDKTAGIEVHELNDITPCTIEHDFNLVDEHSIENIKEMNELYFDSLVKDCLYYYALDTLPITNDEKERVRSYLDQKILSTIGDIITQKKEVTKIMKRYDEDNK